MIFQRLAVLSLALSTALAIGDVEFKPYVAKITPLGADAVTGTIMVVTSSTADALFYGGFVTGLAAGLQAGSAACSAKNGCGVHIHSGVDCLNSTTQEGHLFVNKAVDPWLVEQYTSDANGAATVGTFLDIGTKDVEGRAFIVHDASGARVGCGLLEPASDADVSVFEAATTPLDNGNTESRVVVLGGADDQVCYVGYAEGLSPDVVSYKVNSTSQMCTAKNGCGTHIHSGTGCGADDQGGHWYDANVLSTDPWLVLGYDVTSANGESWFGGCTTTGFPSGQAEGAPFIVHAVDGSRISCGLLTADGPVVPTDDKTGSEAPTKAPTVGDMEAPTAAPAAGSAAASLREMTFSVSMAVLLWISVAV